MGAALLLAIVWSPATQAEEHDLDGASASDPVEATDALLDGHRVPGHVEVDQQTGIVALVIVLCGRDVQRRRAMAGFATDAIR